MGQSLKNLILVRNFSCPQQLELRSHPESSSSTKASVRALNLSHTVTVPFSGFWMHALHQYRLPYRESITSQQKVSRLSIS